MAENTPLSARDAADRVAKRYRESKHREEDESPDEETRYECENCGSNEFIVYRTYDQQRTLRQTLECDCGEHEIAASREYVETRMVRDGGLLGEDHKIAWGEVDVETIIEPKDREETPLEIECSNCFENADPEQWETEVAEDWEDIDPWDSCEVRCGECDHEIEFGWSHTDKGTKIRPCESIDFNPKLCFPEERFIEDWKRRDWLHPSRRE